MVEENMVDTLLIKVGLPGGGTLAEKIHRLNRMGIYLEGQPVAKGGKPVVAPLNEVKQPEVYIEGQRVKSEVIPTKGVRGLNANPEPMVKRGRPKKDR